MTEILTGKEGLRAALENPDEWEVRVAEDSSSDWMRYNEWRHFDLIFIDMRQFRRIQKPRGVRRYSCDQVEVQGTFATPFVRVNLPYGWEPGQTLARVTVTELIDGAEPEPDWKARCEQAERERDELRIITDRQRENIEGQQRTIDAALQETVDIRQQLVECEIERDGLRESLPKRAEALLGELQRVKVLHDEHLGKLVAMMQGELEND